MTDQDSISGVKATVKGFGLGALVWGSGLGALTRVYKAFAAGCRC